MLLALTADAKGVLVRLHLTQGVVIPTRRYLTPRESAPACAFIGRVVVVRVRVRVVLVRVRVRVTHLSMLAVEGLHCNELKTPWVSFIRLHRMKTHKDTHCVNS